MSVSTFNVRNPCGSIVFIALSPGWYRRSANTCRLRGNPLALVPTCSNARREWERSPRAHLQSSCRHSDGCVHGMPGLAAGAGGAWLRAVTMDAPA